MAVKNKYKLKQEKGVLHIGGGRFFYPEESYELTSKDLADYKDYFVEEKEAATKVDLEKDKDGKE